MRAGNNSTNSAAMGPYTIVTYSTKMNRINTTMGLLMVAGFALSGYPAAVSAALTCAWKAAIASLRSLPVTAAGSGAVKVPVPLRICAMVPGGASILWYVTPAFARKLFAISQEVESNLFLPMGSNWNEHCRGSATTVMGAADCASESAGWGKREGAREAGKRASR